jgi:hypothetical protein
MLRLLLLGALFSLSTVAAAHNVVSGVYADGMNIEGEIGFSSGLMAESGVVVEVFNEAGEKLGETQLDNNGLFTYTAKTVEKHIFKADLSSGHIAEMALEADELSDAGLKLVAKGAATDIATGAAPANVAAAVMAGPNGVSQVANASAGGFAKQSAGASTQTAADNGVEVAGIVVTNAGTAISAAELQSLIRSAVAQQVRPLQKELSAYKEKVMLRDIAGGLGFIFGLFGVAAWASSRRKTGAQ